MMECSVADITLNTKPLCFSENLKASRWKMKWVIPFIILLLISVPSQAQETGPLLMKQELGYTLGGSVFGSGLGVVVWFMDPLNPNVTLKSTVKNGFIAGTALGALFGFAFFIFNQIFGPIALILDIPPIFGAAGPTIIAVGLLIYLFIKAKET